MKHQPYDRQENKAELMAREYELARDEYEKIKVEHFEKLQELSRTIDRLGEFVLRYNAGGTLEDLDGD